MRKKQYGIDLLYHATPQAEFDLWGDLLRQSFDELVEEKRARDAGQDQRPK